MSRRTTVTAQKLYKCGYVIELSPGAAWRSSVWTVCQQQIWLHTAEERVGAQRSEASFPNNLGQLCFQAAAEGTLASVCEWQWRACCAALPSADGVVPGSELSMNPKIMVHKEVLQAEAVLLLLRADLYYIYTLMGRCKKSKPSWLYRNLDDASTCYCGCVTSFASA